MAKVADVKLKWKRSVSADVVKVELFINNNGTEIVQEVGPEVEEFQVVVQAVSTVSFKIVVTDDEGLTSTTEIASKTFGDLAAPQPPTELGFEIIAVRDVPDA